jgi:uncharacterized membrane protein
MQRRRRRANAQPVLAGPKFRVRIAALAIRIGGQSEFVLRLPALLAAILTAWLLYRIGARLFDQKTGLLAALVFTLSPEIAKSATVNARPQAIALITSDSVLIRARR